MVIFFLISCVLGGFKSEGEWEEVSYTMDLGVFCSGGIGGERREQDSVRSFLRGYIFMGRHI